MKDYSSLEQQYGLPIGLLSAVEKQESGGNASAVSPRGAIGNFQFMPATAKQYGIDPTDPAQSAAGAARMYADLAKKYNGDVPSMLAAYNWGQGNVDRHGLDKAPEETRNYIAQVMDGMHPYMPVADNSVADPKEDGGAMGRFASAIGNAIVPSAQAAEPVSDDRSVFENRPDDHAEPSAPTPPPAPSPAINLMLEAERRGILPADKSALLAEARKRGLISNVNTPTPPSNAENKGFFSRAGEDLSRRGDKWNEIQADYNAGKTSLPAAVFQKLGNVEAGGISDIAAEGIKSAFDAVTPPKDSRLSRLASQDVSDAGNYLFNSKIGKGGLDTAQTIAQAYQDAAQESPNAYRDIEAGANIVGVLPLLKPIQAATEGAGTLLSKSGTALIGAGENQAQRLKSNFIKDLITPKETPTVKADQFSRATEQGLLNSRVVEPTSQEKSIINTISGLPVGKNKSLLANYNIIANENTKEAENLIAKLKQKDVAIHPEEINAALGNTLSELGKNPYITGSAETSAQRVLGGMQEALKNNPSTASGLLQARKDFDTWVKSQKGQGLFDSERDAPVKTAVLQFRSAINDLVESKVPNVGYKASLQKQSNLYRAMDAIESKGGYEASNAPKRLLQRATDAIPVKGAIQKGAVLLGGAGAAAVAPQLTGAALGLYGAGKALNSPTTKKIVGNALKTTGDFLGGGEKEVFPAPKLLPPAVRPLTAPANGKPPRPMTDVEWQDYIDKGRLSEEMGNTPDIRRAQSKLNRGRAWDEVEAAQKATRQADIEKYIRDNKPVLSNEIEAALRRGSDLSDAKEESVPTNAMREAFKRATGKHAAGGHIKHRNLAAEFLGRKYA